MYKRKEEDFKDINEDIENAIEKELKKIEKINANRLQSNK